MKTLQQPNSHIQRVGIVLAMAGCILVSPAFSQPADVFGLGANNIVYALVPQADGKVLAGGNFSFLGGQSRRCIGQLNADGTLDASFISAATSTSLLRS
jgi:hypothetical protein